MVDCNQGEDQVHQDLRIHLDCEYNMYLFEGEGQLSQETIAKYNQDQISDELSKSVDVGASRK